MLSQIRVSFVELAEFLNRYANLLLVIVTTVYVLLTWRNLKALQRASFREREQRHLDDIKRYVVGPVLQWLRESCLQKLRGQSPLVEVKTRAIPRSNPAVGEPLYEYPRRLEHRFGDVQAITSGGLFSHVSRHHFPEQLAELRTFLGTIDQFASDCANFARACADEIASTNTLRRTALDDRTSDAADSDSLVEVCLRDFGLGKAMPLTVWNRPAAEALELLDGYSHRILGRGLREPMLVWANGGVALVHERWIKEGWRERIEHLLAMADSVHGTFQGLEYTYDLLGDCEYIGGKITGLLQRIKRRMTT